MGLVHIEVELSEGLWTKMSLRGDKIVFPFYSWALSRELRFILQMAVSYFPALLM